MGQLLNSDFKSYDYKIVEAGNDELLEERVKEMFKKGYTCLGGPFVNPRGYLCQAMEKKVL